MRTRNFFISLLYLTLGACSAILSLDEILPDSRDEYRKSEALPDLEVPPDLTENANETTMIVPGEDGTTLVSFKKQRENRKALAAVPNSIVVESAAKEQWLAVRGSKEQIWASLRNFFTGKGCELEHDDVGIAVMETRWSEPVIAENKTYRNRYKIFAEPGAEPDFIILYISNMRQQQRDDNTWSEQIKSLDGERLFVEELNLYLNGTQQQTTAVNTGQSEVASSEAEITEVGLR